MCWQLIFTARQRSTSVQPVICKHEARRAHEDAHPVLQAKNMPRQPSGWMRGRGGFLADQLGAVHEAAVRVQVCGAFISSAQLPSMLCTIMHGLCMGAVYQAHLQHRSCAPAASQYSSRLAELS